MKSVVTREVVFGILNLLLQVWYDIIMNMQLVEDELLPFCLDEDTYEVLHDTFTTHQHPSINRDQEDLFTNDSPRRGKTCFVHHF